MPTGLKLTRSHITTVHAAFNPFHPATARPLQLLLNLLSIESKTISDLSAAKTIKGSPSPMVNVLVSILPRNIKTSEVTVGYTDGKTEKIVLAPEAGSTTESVQRLGVHPRKMLKDEEVMSIAELVNKVDGWARVLKQKDE